MDRLRPDGWRYWRVRVWAAVLDRTRRISQISNIFTLAGGGGGFAVGLLVGLAAFDDSVNSDRKVWTIAVLSGVGGAIGGYFLGRALDKSHKSATVTRNADLHRSFRGL